MSAFPYNDRHSDSTDEDPKHEMALEDIHDVAKMVSARPSMQDVSRLSRSINRKIDLRLVVFAMFMHFSSIMDRSNIGNALIMNKETNDSLTQVLGLSSIQSNIAVMLFAVGELMVVAIVNQSLRYVGPNIWLGTLVIGWGIVSMLTSVVRSFAALCVLRWLLGVFEGGLFPGLIFCMSLWYRQSERSTRIASLWATASLAGAFGGVIAYGVSHMEHIAGKHAWEWLFIIEGGFTICIGIAALFFFPVSPEKCTFLTPEERAWATRRLGPSSSRIKEKPEGLLAAKAVLKAIKIPYLWYQWLAFGTVSATFISLASFSPSIINGLGQSTIRSQLLSVPPYALAFVLMVVAAPLADRFNMRSIFVAGFSGTCSIMFLVLALLPAGHYAQAYGVFIVAVGCFVVSVPLQLSWITTNHAGTDAISVAIGNTFIFAQIFQCIGSWIYRPNDAPAYHTGHFINFAFMMCTCVLSILARFELIRMKKKAAQPNASIEDAKANGDTFLAL